MNLPTIDEHLKLKSAQVDFSGHGIFIARSGAKVLVALSGSYGEGGNRAARSFRMSEKERTPLVVSPFVEHCAKCELAGCGHAARAIVRYPDLALSMSRQVCLCAAHTIRAITKAFDAGFDIQEQGRMDARRLKC